MFSVRRTLSMGWCQRFRGRRDEKQHQSCGEDHCDGLAVKSSEGVVSFVKLKELRDGGRGLDAHAAGVQIAGALTRAARLDVVAGHPRPMQEDDDLMELQAVRQSLSNKSPKNGRA